MNTPENLMQTPFVITAVSALTPFGTTAESCARALAGHAPLHLQAISPSLGKPCQAAFVVEHDVRELLGTRSISQLDRLSRHVGISIRSLLTTLGMADVGVRRPYLADERISIVLGTTGSFQSTVDYEREAIRDPRYVQPSLMPNMVLNVPASYAAIRHAIRGSCITLTDGPVSALKALAMGITQLRCGRIDLALCGGAEEATPAAALVLEADLYRQGRRGPLPALLDGAIFLALEPEARAREQGRDPLLGIHACQHRFVAGQPAQALQACLDALRPHPAFERISAVDISGPIDAGMPGLPGREPRHIDKQLSDAPLESANLGPMLSLLTRALTNDGTEGSALVVQCDTAGNAAAALVQKG